MLIMNKVQNNILGGQLNFSLGKQNLGSLCPNGQVPSKVNVGPRGCRITQEAKQLKTIMANLFSHHQVPSIIHHQSCELLLSSALPDILLNTKSYDYLLIRAGNIHICLL